MFVGLYIGEIFLAALFFLAQDESGSQSGVVHGILMIALILISIFFQKLVSKDFFPLIDHLPVSLAGQASGTTEREEETSHKSDEPIIEKDLKVRPTSDAQEHCFDHPAQWKEVGVLWLADDDDLKIGENGVRELQTAGLKASSYGARFSSPEGNLIITRSVETI